MAKTFGPGRALPTVRRIRLYLAMVMNVQRCVKKGFPDEVAANLALKALQRSKRAKDRRSRSAERVVYRCSNPHCSQWHISYPPRKSSLLSVGAN